MIIVNVNFEDRREPGTFNGSAYSYLTDHPVAVGDFVNVPTKYGERMAKVVETDVPVGNLQCKVGQLKMITGPATPTPNLFSGFFD